MRRLLLCLLLGGCGNADASIVMQPQLTCVRAYRCNLIEWSIGFRQGPRISGAHGGCFCRTPEDK